MKRSMMLLAILVGYLVTSSLTAQAQDQRQQKEERHEIHENEREVHEQEVERREVKQEESRREARREHARLERDLRTVRRRQQESDRGDRQDEIRVKLELELDDDDQEEQEIELEFDDLEEKLEAWADEHAESWERWAEGLEQRMERWATDMENEWEQWAENYAERWEAWAEDLEAGVDDEDLQLMLKKNLKMLSNMPLDSLTEGLAELSKDEIPLESLGELNELIAGSLERSMVEIERSLKDAGLNEKIEGANRESQKLMKLSLQQLEKALSNQREHLDDAEQKQIIQLKKVLQRKQAQEEHARAQKMALQWMQKNPKAIQKPKQVAKVKVVPGEKATSAMVKNKIGALKKALVAKSGEAQELKVQLELLHDHGKSTAEVEQALQTTVAELQAIEAKLASLKIMLEQESVLQADRQAREKAAYMKQAIEARHQAERKAFEADKRRAVEVEKMRYGKLKSGEQADAVKVLYGKLLEKSERLEAKESELQQMRREIDELRQAVEKMQKGKGGGETN